MAGDEQAKAIGEEEEVMSEVHLGCPPRFAGTYTSTFTFSVPTTETLCDGPVEARGKSSCEGLHLDDDGDLVLTRRKKPYDCYKIRHKITSSIPSVGLQVWKAAMLLADFVLHVSFTSSDFDDIAALELGAGTGIVGIMLARVARVVYLTDYEDEVLHNCAANALTNSSMLKFPDTSIRIRKLDWRGPWPPLETLNINSPDRLTYSWTLTETEEVEETSLILAADVIYSDELTDSFFNTLESLMSRGSDKILYLALEKRYNFSLDDLDVVANGYYHFRSFLKSPEDIDVPGMRSPCFIGELMDISQIPKYINEYDRGKDLELWKITYWTPERE